MDNKERKKGETVIVFMTQVAAMSWAETQHPETTLASQSFGKWGFGGQPRYRSCAHWPGRCDVIARKLKRLFCISASRAPETSDGVWSERELSICEFALQGVHR